MAKPRTICRDACTWISYIQKEMPADGKGFTEPRYEMCRETLKRAEAGEYEIATSAFTLAEVCKRPLDPASPARNLAAFFEQPYILLIPVDMQVGRHAQQLQVAGLAGIKPPDAIHIASATVWNIPVFQTFDRRLIDLTRKIEMADGNLLEVMMPTRENPTPELLQRMEDNKG
jgi:predicted nucleic acid-binding protein